MSSETAAKKRAELAARIVTATQDAANGEPWSPSDVGRAIHAAVGVLSAAGVFADEEDTIDVPAIRAALETIEKHYSIVKLAIREATVAPNDNSALDVVCGLRVLGRGWRPARQR